MNSMMRMKLDRNRQYHAAVAEYHSDQAKAAAEAEGAPPPVEGAPPSNDQKLAETHAEAAKQIQDLLDATPIAAPGPSSPISRNTSPDVRPTSGVFH
jgi:regulator of protease activity HflC (stomatin/prohibitin superfamily)